jgi:4-hydroxyphenylpyruvate dioxygenase
VATVPGDRIFFVQLGDAELVKPTSLKPKKDDPPLLPWSRSHRLFPVEQERGGYMPVELVAAAVLATGYSGPLSLEVFTDTLNLDDPSVPRSHARRGYSGLQSVVEAVREVPKYWDSVAQNGIAYKLWKEGNTSLGQI